MNTTRSTKIVYSNDIQIDVQPIRFNDITSTAHLGGKHSVSPKHKHFLN